ncbi:MAG: hypothetical protein LBD09_03925 [Treponema sp.]|jgi:hypothetical protein|nr:hypothetical protein [Treponema sp.]
MKSRCIKNRPAALFLPCLFALLLWLFSGTAAAQSRGDTRPPEDPAAIIGMTLEELFTRYGVPKQVYAVRGTAAWQDDVVFVYDAGEFYIFGNRVWQLKLRSAYHVKDGDNRAAVTRTLGAGRDFEGYTLYQLPGKAWPLMLRINWTQAGRAAEIYIYRPDF